MKRPVGPHDDVRGAVGAQLEHLVRGSGPGLERFALDALAGPACPVLDFAASGAMWLTGDADGPPVAPEAPVMAQLRVVCAAIALLGERVGRPVTVDPYRAVTGRAGDRGFRRNGSTSANGSCRLVRAEDGWVALNLPRPSDFELLPAVLGGPIWGDPWAAVGEAARGRPGAELVERAQLVGIAAGVLAGLGRGREAVPFRVVPLGPSASRRRGEPIVVVDFSALWAGPLCAHLLGAAGATVVKVEDPDRPDGARVGDPHLFRLLHAGHRVVHVPFSTDQGARRIRRLVETADVVVESSRPRALARLGLSPETFLGERPGRTWVSITGYGRSGPRADYVAFGDDAAVSGGLVGWSERGPVFCADAIADPVAGLFAALGGLCSVAVGGGLLVDVSMSGASAFVQDGPPCRGPHEVQREASGDWFAWHGRRRQLVVAPLGRPASAPT
jgi:crotonobetainyl-CoA:carnitine CoA-transferase CaiB-like acyl-CoA transferase